MLDLVTSVLRSIGTGLFLLAVLTWVLVEEMLDWALWDKNVPVRLVKLTSIAWDQHDYATEGDQQFTVQVEYRNQSALQLVDLRARYSLYDCVEHIHCTSVHMDEQKLSLSTEPGYRGRFQGRFIVPRMVDPRGRLRLDVQLLSATGQDSDDVPFRQNDQI
ncbi:hypothetical protein [Sphingomonas sp. LHG3406-1]|uniref:hypothetical protein n=1 Tax=Sphingomonas sp. LHG3406-1 TaxID=2804617 RepID=UPI002612CF9B|nr:hypothetical protein [Sphingomonas sp. LHG3406-1]